MEGGGLLEQLGINWKLFLSQAVNFFILLLILRAFVYKPLLAVIKKRNEKIKQGLEKAEEANIRLKEVDNIAKEKLKITEQESINIIKKTEQKAKQLEQFLQKETEARQKELLQQVELGYKRQQEEVKNLIFSQALELVKKTIIKTVELKPQDIDEALIQKAVSQIKENEI
jgi:F-type H+-transporting ATPase subunit b